MTDTEATEQLTQKQRAESTIPLSVRIGTEWTWRLLVLLTGVVAVGFLIHTLSSVVIPFALAMLATAFCVPFVDWLQRKKVPRSLAVVLVILGVLAVIVGILTFVVLQFIDGLPALSKQVTDSIGRVQAWLTNGPLHLSDEQIRRAGDSLVRTIQSHQAQLTSGALTTATVITEILTGALLMVFCMIFLLYGGRQIWEFVTRIVPNRSRGRVRAAGVLGFQSLVGYVRATVAVAGVDAIGIGAGLAILGVPLALPLASLVFIGAFIPIIGAFVTGFLAVFVALVTQGLLSAVITLAIIVAVMQLEGHVLQPLFLGRAVQIHPLAVVLSIATGMVLAGIIGALLAVPIVAVLNTSIRALLPRQEDGDEDTQGGTATARQADRSHEHPERGGMVPAVEAGE